MTKRAALLCRVSTVQQAHSSKHGIPTQLTGGKDYAEKNSFQVTGEYIDRVSGTSETREALFRLLAEADKYDLVIVYDLTRLARDEELSFRFLRLLQEAGLEVHSVIPGGVVEVGLHTAIDIARGADDRRRIVDKTQKGLIGEAINGKLPNGIQLFGFLNVPGKNKAAIDPRTAPTVVNFLEMSAKGYNGRQIADELTQINAPRRSGGGPWLSGNVCKLIRNTAYKGEFVWEHKTAGRFVLPVPAIVSPELWERAQQKRRGRPPNRNYLLRSCVRCGNCDKAMTPIWYGQRAYYRCTNKYTRAHCPTPVIRMDKVLADTEALLRSKLTEPEMLREIIASDTPRDDADQRRLDELGERETRVKEMRLDGIMTREEALSAMANIERQRAAIRTVETDMAFEIEEYAEAALTMPYAELVELVRPTFVYYGDIPTVTIK